MKLQRITLLGLFFLMSLQAFSQERMNSEKRAAVIEKVEELMDSIYVFPEVADKAMDLLKQNEQEGKYASMGSPEKFADALAQDLRKATKDLHINLRFDPEAIAREKKKKTNIDKATGTLENLKRENFGFTEVKVLDGNIGYINIEVFVSPEYAAETAIAAMNFLQNTDAIIFDLRNHRGGSPQMIQLLQSYLFGSEPVHLNNFYFRPSDEYTQTWTLPYVPGQRKPDVDVYVLTSKRSFSAAEEFAFNIKNLERGTLIGETTGGAANPGRTYNIDESFTIFIPSGRAYSPITGKNWEGVGVEPHIQIPENEALSVAHALAIEKLSEKSEDSTEKAVYDWHLKKLNAKQDAIEPDITHLNSLVGTYDGNRIILKENQLIYRRGDLELELVQLRANEFEIKHKPDTRLLFSEDKQAMKEVHISGKTRIFERD